VKDSKKIAVPVYSLVVIPVAISGAELKPGK
jgi:hypothetical protein